jgi:hypothetical protein
MIRRLSRTAGFPQVSDCVSRNCAKNKKRIEGSMMNIARKLVGFLSAMLLLVAFAMPASAQVQKIYSIAATSTGTNTVAIKITNETPNGNSTINSFVINRPNSSWRFTSYSATAPAAISIGSDGNVYVNGFDGLKAGQRLPYTITINLTIDYQTALPACGTGYLWTAAVYTGNSFSGDTFAPVDPVTKLPTAGSTLAVGCYSVTNLPTTIAAGGSASASNVIVKNESAAGGPTLSTVTLSLPSGTGLALTTPATVTVNLLPQATATITVAATATCAATSGAWGSSATGSASFTLKTALPSLGVTGGCSFSLNGLPASVYAGTTTTATATLKNESAAGGPTLTALTLVSPSGAITITSTNPVTGLSLAPGASTPVTVSVTAPCGAAGGVWGASATGTGGSMGLSNTLPTVTVNNCTLAYTPAPASAIQSGKKIEDPVVGLTAYNGAGGVLTSWNGSTTWSTSDSSVTVNGGNPVGSNGAFTYPDLTVTGATGKTFTLTAMANGTGTSASVTSSLLKIFPGVLFCGDNMDPSMTNPGGGSFGSPGYAAGKRWDNKDGSPCLLVGYSFTNTILTNNSTSLTWDTSTQPNAVFDYTVFWRPEFVDPATGLPKRRVKVAWEVDGSSNPIYVWGNACLSKDPPSVYTTLAVAIPDAVTTAVTVNANAGTLAVPFPVVVGTERMTVTSVGGGTNWTVVRGAGGTTAATHPVSAKVMTTPLPIDPNATKPSGGANPYLGKQDRMCIWDEEFQSAVPSGSTLYDCSATSPGYSATSPVACVIRKTSVFDIGDGFMTLD